MTDEIWSSALWACHGEEGADAEEDFPIGEEYISHNSEDREPYEATPLHSMVRELQDYADNGAGWWLKSVYESFQAFLHEAEDNELEEQGRPVFEEGLLPIPTDVDYEVDEAAFYSKIVGKAVF